MRKIGQARALRQSGGLAEARLWERLRGGAVDGHKFRRQHPIGPYIADFACERLRLVIEIDGGVHRLEAVVLRDRSRQADIEARGWTVVRFNSEVPVGEAWRIDEAIRAHAKAIS